MATLRSELTAMVSQFLGLDAEAYTSLTTIEDEDSFVTKDGGLMSLIEVHGHRRVVGPAELESLTQQLMTLLGSALGADCHTLDIVFSSDPGATASEIERLLAPSRRTADRQGLDLKDIFAERARHLPRHAVTESVTLALWSAPAGLPRAVRRQERREKRRLIRRQRLPGGFTRDNQNSYAVNGALVDTHRSFVAALVAEMTAFGFDLAVLPARTACRALRAAVDPEWTPEGWEPLLPGGALPAPREWPDGTIDHAACWLPAFGMQLIPRGMEILDERTLRVGDRLYQPIIVDLPQLTAVQRFERLFERVHRERLPWRLLVRLTGGAEAWLRTRRVLSGLLYFAGHPNRLINASATALRRFLNEGHLVVRAQMALTSWVSLTGLHPPGRLPLETLRARTAQLAAYVQAWGTCTVREVTGHPAKAWVSTLAGMSRLNVATRYAAPLGDVLKTLPLFRPASLWRAGAVLYRTRDGKLFPYQPGSAEQGTWNELYFARPGSGKSVTLNANNLGLILSPGFSRLPLVRIIEIGPSSEGLISLLQEALPPGRRQEAQFHALANRTEGAINPLDTPLGLRYPRPPERAFLVSFISVLATRPGSTEPPEGVSDLIGLVIDLAYRHFADEVSPKHYAAAQDVQVDRALARHGIALDTQPTWWEVVDALFDAGDLDNAVRAQRYAVPLLSDLIAVAQQPPVRDLYGEMCLKETAESPLELFNRVISAATREFPILAYPTRFDLGNARVASLDVGALCGDMTPVGQRQTAIAYLLARQVLGRDLFMDASTPAAAPPRYQRYHRERIEENAAYPKKLCADEKHRCGPIAAVNAQFVRDMREGRKMNVQVALASQILADFSAEMVELATACYLMEYGNDDTAEAAREKFSVSRSAMALLKLHGTGPTPAGAPFLCALKTKRGLIEQLLYLTSGPIELWALSTTAEDRVIRQRLYEQLGPRRARAALARAYPGGSAKADLDRRLEQASDPTVDREAMIDRIVAETAALARQLGEAQTEETAIPPASFFHDPFEKPYDERTAFDYGPDPERLCGGLTARDPRYP